MHINQKRIIARLVFDNGLRFSHLADDFEYEDKLPYHLKQLLKHEYITKQGEWYHLTPKGLKFSASFNLNTFEDRMDQVSYVGLICKYKDNYLLHKKIAEPAFSWYELVGGRPYAGEKLEDTCARILKFNTGTVAPIKYNSVHHRTILSKTGEILFDNMLIIFEVTFSEEDIDKFVISENNFWFKLNEIEDLENKYPEIDMCILKKDWKEFSEYKIESSF